MEEKGKVCVTGAGGYVASWLVKLLLSKGYMVHGTVKDPDDEKNSHLKMFEKAQEKLQLFKANLVDYDSLYAAIEGCSGVFHVATPVPSSTVVNPEISIGYQYAISKTERLEFGSLTLRDVVFMAWQETGLSLEAQARIWHKPNTPLRTELLELTVRGMLNVLKACSETGVERVVVVSSVGAVMMNPHWPPNRPMDEDCWSNIDYCRESKSLLNWYNISKTTSEREALKYAENTGLDVVTVCPSLVLGPLLQPTVNGSSQLFIDLFKGGVETTDNRLWFIVDVRDVAEALLLVYDKKEASGRYICASHPVRVQSLVEKLKTKYPSYNYPKNYTEVDQELKLISEKLKRLGWECRSLEETIVDSVEYYQEAGILNKD